VEGVEEGAEEDQGLDPGLGPGLAPGIVKVLDQDPSHALDRVLESRKKKIPSLVLVRSLAPRSVPSLAQDPREGASLAPVLERSLALDQDRAPSPETRKGIPSHGLAPSLNLRDPSLALAQQRDPSPVLDLTAQSPGLDLGPSLGETKDPLLDPTVKRKKLRKHEVALSPDQNQDLNLQLRTETNQCLDRGPRLLRKWKRMGQILLLQRMAMNKMVAAVINKVDVFFPSIVFDLLFPLGLQ
jgi:hypothetical protein